MFIPALSGLRGLAALLVFFSHSMQRDVLPDFFGRTAGHMGVMLFFTLSAFLMTILYVEKVPDKTQIAEFWIARFSRIYPLHFVLLSIALVALYLQADPKVFPYVIGIRTYLENIFFVGRFNVFWTISTEFQFYLIFTIVWIIGHKIGKPYIFVSAISFIACFAVSIDIYPYPSGYVYKTIHFFAVGILAGMLFLKLEVTRNKRLIDGLLALFLILFALSLPMPFEALTGIQLSGFWSPWLLMLSFLIVLSCAAADGPVSRMLGSRIGQYLGNLSFAIYLLHIPVLHMAKHYLVGEPMLVQFLLAFVVTMCGSAITFKFFENPMRIWIRQRWYSKK